MNEVIPRERSGRPDIDSQEGAWLQQFVMGNDDAEIELSVESRSLVNRVDDQIRKRQKNFKCYRKWRNTFYDLENVNGCNNGISSIHGKELTTCTIVNPLRTQQISHSNKVRHIYKIGRRRNRFGNVVRIKIILGQGG